MNTERDTTRLLESWLAEPEPPLDDHVIDEAIARLPHTPQRRRWWPLRWFPLGIGATRSAVPLGPRSTERKRTMVTATRVAAGVTVLALTGSLALIAGPLQGPTEPPPPAAVSPPPASTEGWVATGAMRLGPGTFGETVPVDDRTEMRGSSWATTWTSDDPRLAGDGTFVVNTNTYQTDDGSEVSAGWSELTIENENGSWSSHVPASGVGVSDFGRSAFWFDGAGGYEGLSAFVLQTLAWNVAGAPYYEFEAWIVPGDAHLSQMIE